MEVAQLPIEEEPHPTPTPMNSPKTQSPRKSPLDSLGIPRDRLKVQILSQHNTDTNKLSHVEDVVRICSSGKYDSIWIRDCVWFVFYVQHEDADSEDKNPLDDPKNKIIGCFRIAPMQRAWFMSHFCVLPEFQGKSLGKSMIEFFEVFAKSRNFRQMIYLYVQEENSNACHLYESTGFKKIQVHEDEGIIMYGKVSFL